MNLHRFLLILLLLPLSCVCAAETDMVTLTDLKDGITGFRYLWQVPRTTLTKLSSWSPADAEAPLSPHKAAKVALEDVKRQFPASTKLRPYSISLQEHEIQSGGGAVWVYYVSFDSKPEAKGKQKSLLEVLVLLDGSVVSPIVTPLK